MNQEPLPQIHLIRDTDLSVFAYELHIFAGDFLRECEFNMRSLATNTGADSIAIMGKNHMWLSDALFAYCSTADLHQMILTTEFIGARAFLFHTDRSEGGHLYGDVLMMDLDTLRQDIKRNILYPCGVNIERKDGSAATVSLKEWTEMELYEKDALKSWGFSYAPNQVTEWQYHYSTMFRQWMDQAFRYMPQDLEERLNMQYMLHRCNRLRQPPESAADRNGFVLSRPTQGHLGSPGWDGTCFHSPQSRWHYQSFSHW